MRSHSLWREDGVEARGRLVEQHDLRVADQRDREAELALHAAAQVLRQLGAVRPQLGLVERGVDDRAHLRLGHAAKPREEREVVGGREQVPQRVVLVDDAEARRAGEELSVLEYRVPRNERFARGRVDRAHDHRHCGRLARAVRAEQPKISPCATPAHIKAHATVGGAPGRFGR